MWNVGSGCRIRWLESKNIQGKCSWRRSCGENVGVLEKLAGGVNDRH